MMRIAIHDYAGFSFSFALSWELSRRGHRVMHLFTQASGGPKASCDQFQNENLQIINIGKHIVDKDNLLKRWVQERRYGNFAVHQLNQWQPDVVISGNTPLEAQKKIMSWASNRTIPSIFWLHDLLSVAAGSILSRINRTFGHLAFKYLNNLEIGSLNQSSHIVSISDDFSFYLNRWNIDGTKVSVIPNWGPIEQIPVLARNNEFSEFHGLNGKFVLLYAGTLGKKQDISLIANIATNLADDDEIKLVVATDERGHRLLEQAFVQPMHPNLLRLPLQSSNNYPYLLASANATLVTLEPAAGKYCVPSKLWSAYCAQRPSIIAVDRLNLSARITERINAGIVVPPGAAGQCIAALKKLKTHPSICFEMGKNARRYAETHFPINHIADKFEIIIERVVNRPFRLRHLPTA